MSGDPAGLLENRARLRRLDGRLCPHCRRGGQLRPVRFDGRSLACFCEHGWSNPDAAEAELLEPSPRTCMEASRILEQRRLADAEECRNLLLRLERAVADWLPPEAREC